MKTLRYLLWWVEPSGLASRRMMRDLKLRDREAWDEVMADDDPHIILAAATAGATTTVNLVST